MVGGELLKDLIGEGSGSEDAQYDLCQFEAGKSDLFRLPFATESELMASLTRFVIVIVVMDRIGGVIRRTRKIVSVLGQPYFDEPLNRRLAACGVRPAADPMELPQ